MLEGIAGACITPDAQWVFYTVLDDAWRPCAVLRHRVGTPVSDDVEVFREHDERFWLGVGLSFDERNIVIGTGSKTTTEVLMLPADTPEGEFRAFIPREPDVEYDVSFARFEGAGEDGADIPLAVVYHNAFNPNFEIDVIDMRLHEPPYRLGEGVCIAQGSPYGCEQGDRVEPGASAKPIGTAYRNPANPAILQGARGLGIEGIALHRHYVALSYRADGMTHLGVMTKRDAAEDFLAGRPWRFPRAAAARARRRLGCPRFRCCGPCGKLRFLGLRHMFHRMFHAAQSVRSIRGIQSVRFGRRIRFVRFIRGRAARCHATPVHHRRGAATRHTRRHACATRSPATRARASCTSSTRPPARTCCSNGRAFSATSTHATIWNAACGSRRGTANASPSPWSGGAAWRSTISRCSSPAMARTRSAPIRDSLWPGSACSTAACSMRCRISAAAARWGAPGTSRGVDWPNATASRISWTRWPPCRTRGLADPERTVAVGGSAGGLLMGAVANLAPERFAGIEADVPFVDALTSILDPSLPLTVTEWDEWGDPLHDPEVYRYMKSYTPYENAPESPDDPRVARFPKILITTSMNDTRVLVVEPLKWMARLQAAGVDVIAKIEVEAGHGGTTGRYKQWKEVSFENAWCLRTMGVA